MLQLVNIKKDYSVAGEKVNALKGVDLNFRRSEFVSVLGPSGCGKTTLLNIIGGLDQYTSGDLIIDGKSTKMYSDRDWDTYRNHSIGFIFQSYHLIPHQTILQNVELALMIAGVSKEERRQRAIEALDKVGLKDKMKNRPNQLSGGQAQRVAIARALINDPEIVLADEPTGALDSVTSMQIMELLKEISKDRLVIMVTHNPELAEKYSTRIVSLKDGLVTGDTMPFDGNEEEAPALSEDAAENIEEGAAVSGAPARKKVNKGRKKQSAMSVGMAFGLSVKNLLSKRKRTAMVSVAGSIGIIGVSMVLAISAGVQSYINGMEDDMLSGNPISITQSTYDFTTLMALNGDKIDKSKLEQLVQDKKVGVTSLLETLGTFSTGFEKTNQFTEEYVQYLDEMPNDYINVLQYQYAFNVVNNIYTDFTVSTLKDSKGNVITNSEGKPESALSYHFKEEDTSGYKNEYNMSVTAIRAMYAAVLSQVNGYKEWGSMISSVETFKEVPDNFEYIMSQYNVVAMDRNGEIVTENYSDEELKNLFNSKETLVMVLENHATEDMTLAQYGYFTEDEFLDYALKGVGTAGDETHLVGEDGLPYSMFVGKDSKKFTYYPNDCIYTEIKTEYLEDADVLKDFPSGEGASDMSWLGMLILSKRNQGDKVFKEYIYSDEFGAILDIIIASSFEGLPESFTELIKKSMQSNFYKKYRKPDSFEKSFVANAYSTAYSYDFNNDDETDDIHLPAFDKEGVPLGVKLILEKKEDVSYGCLKTGFYYTHALTEYILETEKESEIVKYLKAGNDNITEVPMYIEYYYVDPKYDGKETNKVLHPDLQGTDYNQDDSGNFKEYKIYKLGIATGEVESNTNLMSSLINSVISGMGTASKSALTASVFGGDRTPIAVYIYPVDFKTKDMVTDYLDKWNNACKYGWDITLADGTTVTGLDEGNKITYTDTVGLIIGMINTMIKMITIALVAFTALSLVVSTVMIGIITYVSVVERVKEIGILRAVGARKKDIKRLFNAETFIIGMVAGLFGIFVTYMLSLVINGIVMSLAGFWGIAALPWWQAVIMVGLSVGLTLISGLIPASAAAKKDPVVALRTE